MNMKEKLEKISKLSPKEATKKLFDFLIESLEKGELEPIIQAKCAMVDARKVTTEEIGKEFTVYSHGKVEKVITLEEDTILLTTLGKDGKPIIDEAGHYNTYDMKEKKFNKKYPNQINGHYVQDGTPMITVTLPEGVIPESGITVLPPGWGGYEGTLMSEGIIMLPFDSNMTPVELLKSYKEEGAEKLDWYPNNEASTYAPCKPNGVFLDETLRKTFNQENQLKKVSKK